MDKLVCVGYWEFALVLAIPAVVGFIFGGITKAMMDDILEQKEREQDRREK